MSPKPHHLPLEERIRLVEDIWDSIAAEQQAIPLTPAQKAELDRRYRRYPSPAMTFEVRLRPEAERDLEEEALWYEEQLPDLGNQFLDEISLALSAIAE